MSWLQTDEYQEVATTLRACRHFVHCSEDDATYWKWIFIAVHNIVQGCMVIALTGSDSWGAKNAKQEKAWRDAHSNGTDGPKEKDRLLAFMELYAKIQDTGMIQFSTVERFAPTEAQTHSMEKLNNVRNEFIHFVPKGWSLDLNGAPKLALDCLEVAEFLVQNSGRFAILQNFKKGELQELITALKGDLAAVLI